MPGCRMVRFYGRRHLAIDELGMDEHLHIPGCDTSFCDLPRDRARHWGLQADHAEEGSTLRGFPNFSQASSRDAANEVKR